MSMISRFRSIFLPGSFHAEELTVISSWLIRLRWAAVCGFFLLAVCLSHFAPSLFPIHMLYIVCLVILFYNFAFFFFLKGKEKKTDGKISPFFIRLQVFLDWIALLTIIDLTGGIFSPLITFFLLHIIINSMIFPPYQCYSHTILALTGLGILFFIKKYFLYVPETTSWLAINIHNLSIMAIIFLFAVFAFIFLASTFLATSIIVRFRQREADVRLLSRRLQESLTRMETLYEATKTMVSSSDINSIFDIIVRETTKIMKAKGVVLRLVHEGEEDLTVSAFYGVSEKFVKKGPVKRGEGLFPKNPDDVIIVENVTDDPRIIYRQEEIEEGIKSIISIPLVHRGEVTGDLRLYSKEHRHFSSDEISFLKILASGAASMIDNARTWQELEEKNKDNIFLAHKLSHDLRAPVVAVQSLLSAMEEGYAGEISSQQKDILKRCIKKQEQLVLLINNILNLAESQVSTHDQQLVTVYLDEVAGDMLKLLEVLFQQKKIMTKYYKPKKPVPFQEVPGDFQRLFSNLLENALRYTPEGGMVELEVKDNAEDVSITVKDTGIGIEPEEREKIFDDFYRTKKAKQFVKDGTGLGLPTVKSIVKRYNGFINLESQPGKGTTFFITLPKQA